MPVEAEDSAEGLRNIDRQVIQLFALVEEAVAGATHALLTGDREAARALVAKDAELDSLYLELEGQVHGLVMEGGLSRSRKQWLLALLSMLPELERSGDLAEHVAQRAIRNLPAEMPARVRGLIERMGSLASQMWKMAADSYADRAAGVEQIDLLDDQIDDLHVQLIAEIAGGGVAVPAAIELALVGRFYERLGDHAVNISRRVPARLRSEAIS
jgi:phosphate transport system protein